MRKNYAPTNVDLLNIGHACNLNCLQCYYKEPVALGKRCITGDLVAVDRIIGKFTDSSIFVYPMEISTSMEIVPLISRVGQTSVLSNGVMLDEHKIAVFLENGVSEMKITLFSNPKEHAFFNQVDEESYWKITENIEMCKRMGLSVVVNNVLSKITKKSIRDLTARSIDLGVDKITFLRLKPVGNGKNISREIWLDKDDMLDIIQTIECLKAEKSPIYFSYSLSLGPDFYKKTIEQSQGKIRKSNEEWTKSKYLCPSIDGNYFGISLRTGKIYGCFFAMDQEEFSLGEIDLERGMVVRLKNYPLDSKTLSERLRGNCHRDNCIYQEICLSGCRSTAFIFAKDRGDADPMFAGMDICITKCKAKLAR